MHNAVTFLKLDLLTIRPYLTLKNAALLVIFAGVMSFAAKMPSIAIAYIMMFGMLYIGYPFSVGEQNGIDSLYTMLSVDRRSVVRGRYLFSLGVLLTSLVIAGLLLFLVRIFAPFPIEWDQLVLSGVLLLFLFGLLQAVQLPIYFSMGFMKARMATMIPLAGLPLGTILLSSLFRGIGIPAPLLRLMQFVIDRPAVAAGALMLLLSLIMWGSYRIAVARYERRELV